MKKLLRKLSDNAEALRTERRAFAKEHGDKKIGDITVAQVLGGMRGLTGLLCDTSSVVADEGLRIRNIPILELTKHNPEDVFYLLCTGEFPDDDARQELAEAFNRHSSVPYYVWNVLESMPIDSHPMVLLSTALMAMERESKFRQAYNAGASRADLWPYMAEDCVMLLSRITTIAAAIYRMKFDKGERIAPRADLDWGANFAHMLGLNDSDGKFTELMRMYLVLHSDHGGGNVSAMTAHTVGSALSDVFYALPAGLNGLAGPLHGLANQECLKFVLAIQDKFGGAPSDEELTTYLWDTLNGGKVIPGFGHAVLRVTDPRFTAFNNFGKENLPDDQAFKIVDSLFRIAPKVLTEHGKAKSVWPNVDAASGALLYHYGMTEYQFYTVMFGVSRALGICSQLIINRSALSAIVRPKAITTAKLRELIGSAS